MSGNGPAVTPTLDREELDELKSRVDLVALLQAHGLPLKKVGKNWLGHCPFHEDQTASLSVNPAERLWNCFGCEAGGDGLRFLQLKENLEFAEAVERLRVFAKAPPPAPSPKPRAVPQRNELLGRVLECYVQGLRESAEAQQYLDKRGLGSRELWDVFRVGYADGRLLQKLPSQGPVRQAFTDLGFLTPTGKEHFRGCLVVPLDHPDEGLVGFYGRKIDPEDPVPHLYLPGPKRGVLHWQALKQARRVWLAESVLDALSLWTAGLRDVSCLYGAQSLPIDLEALLGRFGTPEVVFALDGDRAGQEAALRHARTLASRGLRCSSAVLASGRDPNQLLVEDGPAALKTAATSLSPIAFDPEPVEKKSAKERKEDGFTLVLGDTTYQVTLLGPFVGRLRCTLVVRRGSRLHSDKLDLHSQRNRALSAGQLVNALELPRAEAERHFSEILQAALEWLDEQKAGTAGAEESRKQTPEMSEDEKAEALAFLQRPDLTRAILADCEALGFVGEEKAKLLAYLIGISRKLPNPLSGVVISGSGAGKSTLAEMLEQMTPPEDVLFYSRITAQALFYMSHNLKGMLLLLEERAGGEGADYAIRTLQSRKKLRLVLPVKDPVSGQTRSQDVEVEGPVAYLETTTNPYLNPENASRCFELFMDESADQTRRIHAQQRQRRLFYDVDPEEAAEAIRKKHHNAQRLLKPMRVVVPFADHLNFPSQWLRTRRDNERFLCLLEAITLLYQRQRQRGRHNGKFYVVATVADYRLAYQLSREVLAATLQELTREAQALWNVLVPYVLQRAPQQPLALVFTLRDLRELTQSLSNYRLRTLLNELVELEYVTLVAGQNGKSFQYQLLTTEQKGLPNLIGLTTPDELENLLNLSKGVNLEKS